MLFHFSDPVNAHGGTDLSDRWVALPRDVCTVSIELSRASHEHTAGPLDRTFFGSLGTVSGGVRFVGGIEK
jgi:hypothetical protein